MADRTLRVVVTGEDRGASQTLNNVASKGDALAGQQKKLAGEINNVQSSLLGLVPGGAQVENALSKMKGGSEAVGASFAESLGNVAPIAAGAAAAGIATMAVDGVKKFEQLGEAAHKYQEVTGATAQESSQMSFVFRQLGIDTDAGANAMFRLGKNLGANVDALSAYGVEVAKNRDGTVNMNATLLNVADAYSKLGDQTQKDELLSKAFGRSGKDLASVFADGREGLQKYIDTARQHGSLTQTEINQSVDLQRSQANLKNAVDAVEVSFSKGLAPAITEVSTDLSGLIDLTNRFKLPQIAADINPLTQVSNTITGIGDAFKHGIHWGDTMSDVLKRHSEDAKKATGSDQTLTTAQDAVTASTETLADTVKGFSDSAGVADGHTQELGNALSKLAGDFGDAKTRADDFKTALDLLTGGAVDVEKATINWNQALADANQKLVDNKGSLDINTQAGRDNRTALEQVATAAADHIEAMKRQGFTADQLKKTWADQITAFEKMATNAGLTKDQIRGLEQQYRLVPETITTVINADPSQAIANINALKNELASVPQQTDYQIDVQGGYKPGGPVQHRAAGGPVVAGQTYIVNERGTEYMIPGANGYIAPAPSGGDINITVPLMVDGRTIAQSTVRVTQAELLRLQRRNGTTGIQ